MTDKEIKKALKALLELVLVEGCLQRAKTISNALDLINRLQAENEDKQTVIKEQGKIINGLMECQGKAIIAAYEECIEKVKEKINNHSYGVLHKTVINHKLDNLLKEMVGEDK